MPRSYQIRLSRDDGAAFPDCCAFCGRDCLGSSSQVIARDGMKGKNLLLGWFAVTVPCHRICGLRMQFGRLWRLVRTVVAAAAGLAIGFLLVFGSVENLKSKKDPALEALLVFGFVVASIVAVVVWERLFPPQFTVEVEGLFVTYQFRGPENARRFAEQNSENISKSAERFGRLPPDMQAGPIKGKGW
jgi:hypothetical protein